MKTKTVYWKPIGNPNRKWRQDRFIISTFNGIAEDIRLGVRHAKEAGFNMVETGWIPTETAYEANEICREEGMAILTQDVHIMGSFQHPTLVENFQKRGYFDPDALPSYTEKVKDNPAVAGFYLWDEPCKAEDLIDARRQVDAFEKVMPEKLGFTVAYPSYGDLLRGAVKDFPEYIRTYANLIEPAVLSIDLYPFWQEALATPLQPQDQIDKHIIYRDLGLLRRLSLEKDTPLWFYFQTVDDPMTYEYVDFSFEKIRLQIYLALLHGVKGLQYYNIFGGIINKDGSKAPLFEQVRKLNEYIAGIGNTLMALTSVAVYHSDEVLPDNLSYQQDVRNEIGNSLLFKAEHLPFRTSLGELRDGENNRYIIVVNRDYEKSVSISLPFRSPHHIFSVDKNGQTLRQTAVNSLDIDLPQGGGAVFRVQDAKEEPFLITYERQ